MIRNYSNKEIYRNFKIVKVLSIPSFILSILTVIVYTCFKYIIFQHTGIDEYQIYFYLLCIFIPLGSSSVSIKSSKKPDIGKIKSETKFNNDFQTTLMPVVISFMPYILLIFLTILFFCFGSSNPVEWAYFCGYMFPAHLFAYIADGFLIHNCILIKREWRNNPPEFVLEEKKEEKLKADERNRKITEIKNNKNLELCKQLIEKCGLKFFIKYYKQIKRLPLRDVNVTEDYVHTEKEERLLAAKKIIDLNLTEFALNEIINTYSDILDTDEVEQAKSLLAESQTK